MNNETNQFQAFYTGAIRGSQQGKGRYDLISTFAMRRLAHVLEKGAKEYGDRNWEKGIPIMRHMQSLKRHLDQYIEGWVDEDHAANMLANAMMLVHTDEMVKRGVYDLALDDRPRYHHFSHPRSIPKDCDQLDLFDGLEPNA
jgi:hypothetical protein